MGLFKKKSSSRCVPEECIGYEIAIEVLNGEKLIGFREPSTKRLHYPEFVNSEQDIESYYKKYGVPYNKS